MDQYGRPSWTLLSILAACGCAGEDDSAATIESDADADSDTDSDTDSDSDIDISMMIVVAHEDLPCDVNNTYDVFELDGTAGDTVQIAVDTTNSAAAFDPALVLSTSEDFFDRSSMFEFVDDSFECTHGPTGGLCPWVETMMPPSGTLYVGVNSAAVCASAPGAYALLVHTTKGELGFATWLMEDDLEGV